MRVTTTKSKNAESFYITHSYTKNNGTTTSRIYKKLGTLAELSKLLNTDRDGVMLWAREQARIETEKYKNERDCKTVLFLFMQIDRWITGKRSFEGGTASPIHILSIASGSYMPKDSGQEQL